MKNAQKNYQKLHELSKHTRILQGISSLLDWDQETYMPSGGASIRSEQLKTMAGLIHREKTSRAFTSALGKLIEISTGEIREPSLPDFQQAALKEWRRDYLHDVALPAKFVEDFAKLTSQSVLAWRSAKANNSFQQFAPYLDRIVGMCRKKADLLGYQHHPYDALINEYEPDMTTREIEILFSQLRDHLSPLIKKVKAASPIDNRCLIGEWDRRKQIKFSHQLLETIGFDFKNGRLDFSAHPFSSASHPSDSRITTRLTSSIMSNIGAVLHEAGHGLYEMGLSEDFYGSPLGDARSLGIHESQSRWWETRLGLSLSFWSYFFPLLKEAFKGQFDGVSLESFYQAINKVESSFIRIETDELTYPLHIILRFEIEKGLIEGSLSVRDVPDAWNAKMEQYLGVIPPTNAEGCLQDIHWSMGGIGYFPTYTLGNLYAAHLFEGFAKKHPDWETRLAAGEFAFVKVWLHENIYQHGKRFSSQDLLKRATGKAFTATPYTHYLKHKYETLYRLN